MPPRAYPGAYLRTGFRRACLRRRQRADERRGTRALRRAPDGRAHGRELIVTSPTVPTSSTSSRSSSRR